ncbi:MAG: glycosyltransferase family 4 protein, partial [Proteobacteria bacterium]|nr:glycosyltransferase family 4 protein [Pseudomonadota bacterium]
MNILVINWRDIKHPRAGGAEVRLHHVYEPMAARGHRVILITCRFPDCDEYEDVNGIEVHRYGSDHSFASTVFFSLRSWVKEFHADIVVEDFNKLPFCTPLISPVPVMVQMHHLWLGSIFREAPFPTAFTVWFGEQFLRPFYRKHPFCVVSESTKRELRGYGIPDKSIEIIYNGVDLEFYHQPFAKCEGKPYLFWLGRIQKYKGVLDCCESFKQIASDFPDLNLKIAGSGPFLPELKKWI